MYFNFLNLVIKQKSVLRNITQYETSHIRVGSEELRFPLLIAYSAYCLYGYYTYIRLYVKVTDFFQRGPYLTLSNSALNTAGSPATRVVELGNALYCGVTGVSPDTDTTREQEENDSPASLNASHVYTPENKRL